MYKYIHIHIYPLHMHVEIYICTYMYKYIHIHIHDGNHNAIAIATADNVSNYFNAGQSTALQLSSVSNAQIMIGARRCCIRLCRRRRMAVSLTLPLCC